MTTLALILVLAAPAAARDDKESLEKAAAKVAALDSYAFKGETEFQSQFGNAPAQIPTMEGKYQKDAGMHIKSDRGEIFRKGERTFVKQGQEDWKDASRFQLPAPPAGDPPKKGARGGGMLAQMMIKNFKAPHDEIKELAKNLKEVKKQEKTEKIGDAECSQYYGDLSEESMKGSPLGRMLATFGGANAEVKGSARIWVDAAGNVVIYEVTTKASVDVQGNQVDFSLIRRSEITDAGKTKVEVPEGVQKLLSVKSEDKKTEDK
ncbi:MAG: hypothetical protein HY293_09655 [Planctomycetes bacterium]|nr:hypothetical protein [Planctomycetota bacterium]